MIILDLEWNRGYDRTPVDEIIQIGAVRTEGLGGPVAGTFNAYIKPVIHKKFDMGAKRLPDLQLSRASDLDFATAMEQFRIWCGEETEYAVWGGDDLAALTKNCAYWKIPPLAMGKIRNFQTALSYLLEADQQIALWRAVDYFNIPDSFTFHNALNDAMYTAMIGRWLTPESLEYTPARREKKRRRPPLKLSRHPFSRQPRRTVGMFPTPEQAMDGKQSRRPACPICGRKGCITQWRVAPVEEPELRRCLSVFSCPEHGRFLCRLILTRQKDGMWRGRLSIPVIRPELVQEYTLACQGEVHSCKGGGGGRKRRRRKKSAGT